VLAKLNMEPNDLIFIMLLVFLVPIGIGAVLSLWALRSWLRATAAGTQLTIFEVIGMKLRRVDVDAVIGATLIAQQGEVDVHQVDLQRAYLAGLDIERVTFDYVQAKRNQPEVTFEQFISMARENQLGELPGHDAN
jgi:uncharacterized protein YqfA (UPF0365 family)